jgi:hypothetical protein
MTGLIPERQAASRSARSIAISVEFGPGNKIGGTQHIQKLIMGEPGSLFHYLVLHPGDVGCGSAESSRPKLQKYQRKFFQAKRIRRANFFSQLESSTSFMDLKVLIAVHRRCWGLNHDKWMICGLMALIARHA